MKKHALTLVCGLLILIILVLPTAKPGEPVTHEISLLATRYAYTPGRIKINQGDTVIFTLKAMDVAHGFYLDGYEIEQKFTPGIPETLEITADKAGKYRFRCSVTCGDLHPFMIGELEVRPNIPFVFAIKGSVVLTLCAIVVLFYKYDDDSGLRGA